MRVSRLMLVTLRDVPADAEIISHQLLLRGGYIRRVASGIYAYLPLMWRVLKKIKNIVREEMDSANALETLLPQLQPSEPWKSTGRWQAYTSGEGIMFHLKDRQGRELGLGPTHEEIITTLAKELLRSYRQLPITLYQIQSKFRDEIRPRFGLMRSREFIMKDAYSFHGNESSLKATYSSMDRTYKRIFNRCGLTTVAVDADSGSIGGAASQEFMVTAKTGEDFILTSSDGKYSANQEKAVSHPSPPIPLKEGKTSLIETKGQNTIKDLCQQNDIEASQIVKVILLVARLQSLKKQPVLISIRGDQELNEIKLINTLAAQIDEDIIDISYVNPEKLSSEGLESLPFGSIGPDLNDSVLSNAKSWEKNFLRLTDETASSLKSFICGANKIGKHHIHITWEKLGVIPTVADLRKAKSGDRCLHDKDQILKECRGIEVGHIFQLGRKYSQSLNATFTNENGKEEPYWMGCYGIGISRLAQAAVEQNHDNEGINWPLAIAPFEVIVVIANQKDPQQKKMGEEIYQRLIKGNIDALIDDRVERAGVKFKDADLIGIPFRIVVGRDAEAGKVELIKRSNRESKILLIEEALDKVISEVSSKRP